MKIDVLDVVYSGGIGINGISASPPMECRFRRECEKKTARFERCSCLTMIFQSIMESQIQGMRRGYD